VSRRRRVGRLESMSRDVDVYIYIFHVNLRLLQIRLRNMHIYVIVRGNKIISLRIVEHSGKQNHQKWQNACTLKRQHMCSEYFSFNT
jgi:hypothetical protein